MEIIYKDTKIFNEEELQRLFLSVKWESGNYPKKLVNAMRNSTHVISAWDNECLGWFENWMMEKQLHSFITFW